MRKIGIGNNDSQQEQHYTICTGSEHENPNHWGDEADYYEIGASRLPFYGTLEQARLKGEELVRKREVGNVRAEFGVISIHYWILDSQKNVYE